MVSRSATQIGQEHPLMALPREDLDLITELVLQSGSLKALAKSYGVSYPTIRSRLDKLIERLRLVLDGRRPDPIADLLDGADLDGAIYCNTLMPDGSVREPREGLCPDQPGGS